MSIFGNFYSNTADGSGNQSFFLCPDGIFLSRVYYRLTRGGESDYSVLYTNLLDSTFADGSFSRKNQLTDAWTIRSLEFGIVKTASLQTPVQPECFVPVCENRLISPGEFFMTPPIRLSPEEGDYLCIQMRFSGRRIPNHPESLLPAFLWNGTAWEHSVQLPFASAVTCSLPCKGMIGFLGDSITQGIGTSPDSHAGYVSLLARQLREYSVWNLGLGYGRANDAASDGAWLYKAKQCRWVCVCFGVNDLHQLQDPALLKQDLDFIVTALKKSGVRVLLQTVPPFDYREEVRPLWEEVNRYILQELSAKADAVFDCVPVLSLTGAQPYRSAFGPHPNDEGNRIWAERLLPAVQSLLKTEP